jgi:hypothetical protein
MKYGPWLSIPLSALIIGGVSWLSGINPRLAGFLTALPLTSMVALAMSYAQYSDHSSSVTYAKSIFYSVPLSLLFFVPFLLAEKIKLPFWGLYLSGVLLLGLGYFLFTFFNKG